MKQFVAKEPSYLKVLCNPDYSEVKADNDNTEQDEDGHEEVGNGTCVTPVQQQQCFCTQHYKCKMA